MATVTTQTAQHHYTLQSLSHPGLAGKGRPLPMMLLACLSKRF